MKNAPKKKRRGAPAGNSNATKDDAKEAQVSFRCSSELKAAAVRAASPGKLSDWMVGAIEDRLRKGGAK